MRRFLLLCLTALFTLGAWAQTTYTPDYTYDGINYTLVDAVDGYVEVGPTDTKSKSIEIPEYFTDTDGRHYVIGIGSEAFSSMQNNTWLYLQSITLPEGIEYINDYAFYGCDGLSEINFPETLTTIGDFAFYGCVCLAEIVLPSKLTNIGGGTFWYPSTQGSLRSVISLNTTPPTCKGEATDERYGSSGLFDTFADDTYNNGVLYVPSEAIGSYSSSGPVWKYFKTITPYGLPSFTDDNGLVYQVLDGDDYQCELGVQTSTVANYVVPSTVEYEGDTYTVVGVGASACTGVAKTLQTIELPSSLQYINLEAFKNCTALTKVTFTDPDSNNFQRVGENAFYGCSALESAHLAGEYVTLETQAFYDCSSLTTLTYNTALGEVGQNAFRCGGTRYVPLSSSLVLAGDLADYAFYKCSELTDVTFCEGITSIGLSAFSNCTGLTGTLNIPSTVTSINGSFSYCSGITSVNLPEGLITLSGAAFRETSITEIELPSTLETIGSNCFRETPLETITVPESVTSLGTNMLYGCANLKEAYILAHATTLPIMVFNECTALEKVVLGEKFESFNLNGGASSTFVDCSAIKSITSLNPTPPSVKDDMFDYIDTTNGILYVPVGSTEAYAAADAWHWFYNIAEISDEISVTTLTATDITDSSASLSGSFIDAYNDLATEVGFEYWCDEEDKQYAVADVDCNSITATLAELNYATTYTYRAYATNSTGTVYGEELTFTTDLYAPVVVTLDVDDVTAVSAVLSGTVTQGSEPITRKGFVYWDGDPNLITTIIVTDEDLSCTIEGLTPNTSYTCRAFAITDSGTTYGDSVVFTTLEDSTTGIGGISLDNDENVEGIYTTSGQKLNSTTKGVNIIRYKDGSTKKVLVK